jgi:hypothetical protein
MANRSVDRLAAADLGSAMRDIPNINQLLRRLVARGLLYRPTRGSYRFALRLIPRDTASIRSSVPLRESSVSI